MATADPPFTMLNEAAIATAPLIRDPFDYAFTDEAIPASLHQKILPDVPEIPWRGSYGLPDLNYGPNFAAVIKDLESQRFRRLVEAKFDIDLSRRPICFVMMGNTTGAYNEGYVHPDSKHKIITVLVGFSREWPHERGKLRLCRSKDREDYAFEYPPVIGKMLMFRVCDHSYHGFLPQKGQRTSLQMCYVDSEWYVRSEYIRHRASAFAKSNAVTRTILQWAPKRLFS
jgi:hypothetical protein